MSDAPRLLPLRLTPDGWHILTIHYSAVPHYDFEAACKGLTEEGIRQELEIDWSATKGARIYTTFGRQHHVATAPPAFAPHDPVYCGWDFGGTPAFVLTQLNRLNQWCLFPSISPPEEQTLGIYEFGTLVADHLQREYATPYGLKLSQLRLVHFGDPAGAARPPRTGDAPEEARSCFDILNKGVEVVTGHDGRGKPIVTKQPGWGWKVIPGAVNITDRLEAVRARLGLNVQNGLPGLVVDPRATTLIEGFLGGYCRKLRADGHYEWDPLKNWYSHTMDAMGYVATRLFHHPKDEDDDEVQRPARFRSHAARRNEWS